MSKGEKPIGYWLKEADKSISAKVNKKQECNCFRVLQTRNMK
ncbi:hypothetical protein [Neobacillus sp.]|nr:hypothetical protein [Neobacillus sp.]